MQSGHCNMKQMGKHGVAQSVREFPFAGLGRLQAIIPRIIKWVWFSAGRSAVSPSRWQDAPELEMVCSMVRRMQWRETRELYNLKSRMMRWTDIWEIIGGLGPVMWWLIEGLSRAFEGLVRKFPGSLCARLYRCSHLSGSHAHESHHACGSATSQQ